MVKFEAGPSPKNERPKTKYRPVLKQVWGNLVEVVMPFIGELISEGTLTGTPTKFPDNNRELDSRFELMLAKNDEPKAQECADCTRSLILHWTKHIWKGPPSHLDHMPILKTKLTYLSAKVISSWEKSYHWGETSAHRNDEQIALWNLRSCAEGCHIDMISGFSSKGRENQMVSLDLDGTMLNRFFVYRFRPVAVETQRKPKQTTP